MKCISKQVIQCKNYPISYTLLIKQVKNINLHIEKNGEIVVSANAYVPIERIDAFVSEKINWIIKHQEKVKQRNEQVLISNEFIQLFGKVYRIQSTLGTYHHVRYQDHFVNITYRDGSDPLRVLNRFLDKLCMEVFQDIATVTHQKLTDYHLSMPTIKIREMKSRWGSCIPAKQQITLNKRLIHYPVEFIEYVVLHEFVHLIQPNHSKAFYHIIEYHMPDYKARIALVP